MIFSRSAKRTPVTKTLIKVCIINISMRPLCRICQQNAAAVNGYHRGKVYYRSRCDACIRRQKKLPRTKTRWERSGYSKKKCCDMCGFRAKYPAQLLVYHVNGNLNDCDLRNLKTVCLNCSAELVRSDSIWRRGDLEEDR
jgi:hypothetical protein